MFVGNKIPTWSFRNATGRFQAELLLHVLYLLNEGRATEGHSHYLHTSNRLERLFIDTSN